MGTAWEVVPTSTSARELTRADCQHEYSVKQKWWWWWWWWWCGDPRGVGCCCKYAIHVTYSGAQSQPAGAPSSWPSPVRLWYVCVAVDLTQSGSSTGPQLVSQMLPPSYLHREIQSKVNGQGVSSIVSAHLRVRCNPTFDFGAHLHIRYDATPRGPSVRVDGLTNSRKDTHPKRLLLFVR